MSEFDLDAYAAEARRAPFTFRYGGRSWELAHMADVDWRVIERADQGEISAIREALHAGFGCVHEGDTAAVHTDQALAFDRLPQPLRIMNRLFDQWLKHAGLEPGESPASPDSSASTAGQSKRVSRHTTRESGSPTSTPAS